MFGKVTKFESVTMNTSKVTEKKMRGGADSRIFISAVAFLFLFRF